MEGWFGCILLCDGILFGCQLVAKCGIIRLFITCLWCFGPLCIGLLCQFKECRIYVAVSSGILIQIILMVFLCFIEIGQRLHFHYNRFRVFFGQFTDGAPDCRQICFVRIIDTGAVLCSTVISLAVQACGINRFKKQVNQKFQ